MYWWLVVGGFSVIRSLVYVLLSYITIPSYYVLLSSIHSLLLYLQAVYMP